MPPLWKQDVPLHPAFARLNQSLTQDWFLLPFELRLQLAHAEALTAAKLLSPAEHASIRSALEDLARQWQGASCPESDAEDLHTWIEAELTQRTGEAGRKIHTARSRNDQVATLLSLYGLDAAARLRDRLAKLQRVCCLRAIHWAEWAFPLHTHAQFAAPGTVGFWILRYAAAWDRIRRQLTGCMDEWRKWCPLGSGAVAGSTLALDRSIQARALGYDHPSPNALYSTSSRDECLELLAIVAQCSLHLQGFATDVILFSQTPLAWTRYPAAFATGSSMMPNKRNPDAMELLRGECVRLMSAHGHALTLIKGLPSGYNRDLQTIKPLVHDAAETMIEMTDLTSAFLEQLEFDAQRMTEDLKRGSIEATMRMEALVRAGKALREAHHAVAGEASSMELPASPDSVYQYQTFGSAHPFETRRIANVWLSELARASETD